VHLVCQPVGCTRTSGRPDGAVGAPLGLRAAANQATNFPKFYSSSYLSESVRVWRSAFGGGPLRGLPRPSSWLAAHKAPHLAGQLEIRSQLARRAPGRQIGNTERELIGGQFHGRARAAAEWQWPTATRALPLPVSSSNL